MGKMEEVYVFSVRVLVMLLVSYISSSQLTFAHEYSIGECCTERYVDCDAWAEHPDPACHHAHECAGVTRNCSGTGCFGCPSGCWPYEVDCDDFDMDGIANDHESEDCPSCQYDPDPADDSNPFLDLVGMGSSAWVKDVFVELDYLEAADHSHAPDQTAIRTLVQAFANASVENVNYLSGASVWGVQLHVDTGPLYGEGVMHTVARNVDDLPGAVGTYGDLRRLCQRRVNICEPLPITASMTGGGEAITEAGNEHLSYAPPAGAGAADFYGLKADHFDGHYRSQFFHYVIFAHQVGIDPADVDLTRIRQPCISGRAEFGCPPGNLGGNDLMVTLGGNDRNGDVCWPDAAGNAVGTMTEQLGTLMHELGHNLGLAHGGGDGINYKPNYYSVMNYLYQFSGIPPNHLPLISGHDYSRIDCPTLDETSLDECLGISCLPINGPMDWDDDGVLEGNGNCNPPNNANVAADINPLDDTGRTLLEGYEDWNDLLVYDFRAACTYDEGNSGTVHDEQDPQQVKQARQYLEKMLGASLAVTKTASPEQATLGETLRYTIRLTNTGAGAAEDVVMTDILPDGSEKSIEVGSIAPHSSVDVTVDFVVPSEAPPCSLLTNKVIVRYRDLFSKGKEVAASVETEVRGRYEYAAKLICGVQSDPKDLRLAQGVYATTINIHNPDENALVLCKKLALTYPPGKQRPGKVFTIARDTLKPEEALAVDCMDIEKRLFPKGYPAAYIEGYVIVQSPESLDVDAVYTTASLDREGEKLQHSSVDVERISERRRQGKPPVQPPATGLPDLLPVPDQQQQNTFCRFKNGLLIVTVRNQGTGEAGPSLAEVVDAESLETFSVPTPALGPGDSVDLAFPISRNYGTFIIRLDVRSEVSETNEENNTALAHCLG